MSAAIFHSDSSDILSKWSLTNFSTGAIFLTSAQPTQSMPLTGKAALYAALLRDDEVPDSCDTDSASEPSSYAPPNAAFAYMAASAWPAPLDSRPRADLRLRLLPRRSPSSASESASAEKPPSSASSSSSSARGAGAARLRGARASDSSLPSSEKSAESPSALRRNDSSSSAIALSGSKRGPSPF